MRDPHDHCDHHRNRHLPFPHNDPPDLRCNPFSESPIWLMHHISKCFMTIALRPPDEAGPPLLPLVMFLLVDGDQRLQRDQKELASVMRVTPATITGTLKRLKRDGLIQKKEDPDDLRRNRIELTDKGFEWVMYFRARMEAMQEVALAGIDETERRALHDTLRRIEANLRHKEAPPRGERSPPEGERAF